jgi:zinc protease
MDRQLTMRIEGTKTWLRVLVVLLAIAGSVTSAQNRGGGRGRGGDSSDSLVLSIVKRQLTNGLSVWIVEQHELQVVQMSFQLMTGTDADLPGRYGIASLTAAMLTEGAGSRSALDIANSIEALTGNLIATSGADVSSVQMYVPASRLADALPLLADVIERPAFPAESLDRIRQQRISSLLNARDDPDALAAQAFARAVYGASDRKAMAQIGTVASLKALILDDLKIFHQSAYRPQNGVLIVVGDVESDRVLQLLETYFGKWQPAGNAASARQAARGIERPAHEVTLVDVPDAPQTRVLIGCARVSGSTSDTLAAQLLNTIVRSRFASDRHALLRDYTTGVRSGFEMRKAASTFVIAAAVQPDKTAETVAELLNELARMVEGIPPDELARAKEAIAVQFPRTFQATGRISSRLQAVESLAAYGLPDDYYANYVGAIRAVGDADVQRLARDYFQADHLAIIVIGDRTTVEAPLRALNAAPIKAVAIDDLIPPSR